MARDRREASLNASAKMQLLLTNHDDPSQAGSSNSAPASVDPQRSSGPRRTPAKAPASNPNVVISTSAPVVAADDPILRTIEEVLAQSVSAVDAQPTPLESVHVSSFTIAPRRKQAAPRRRIQPKKSPMPLLKSLTVPDFQSQTARSKSKSPNVTPNDMPFSTGANGLPQSPYVSDTVSGASTSDVGDGSVSNTSVTPPVNRQNGTSTAQLPASSTSVVSTGGRTNMTRRSPRTESPTRYSLVVNPSTSVTGITNNRKLPSDKGTGVKRNLSESRDPPPKKEKLANLLKKRKSLAVIDDPPVVSAPPGRNARSIATKVNSGISLPGKRKFEAVMSKKGEKAVWSWRGRPFSKVIYSEAQKGNVQRTCYNSVKHLEGDVVKVSDCVLLRPIKGQKPHVGKVAAFWESETGDMMMTVFWYWRPEEVETSLRPPHGDMEVYVSNLRDENFVGCIDEKCYVVTSHQHAYFMAQVKEGDMLYRRPKKLIIPIPKSVMFDDLPDEDTDPDIVYFADRGYDGKHKRFWGYYFRGNRLRKYPLDID